MKDQRSGSKARKKIESQSSLCPVAPLADEYRALEAAYANGDVDEKDFHETEASDLLEEAMDNIVIRASLLKAKSAQGAQFQFVCALSLLDDLLGAAIGVGVEPSLQRDLKVEELERRIKRLISSALEVLGGPLPSWHRDPHRYRERALSGQRLLEDG